MQSKIVRFLKGAAVMLLVTMGGCILAIAPRSGPEHVFFVEPAPAFLTEELAVAKARQTLAIEGCQVNEWQLTRVDQPPSKAPDGRPDKYFVRGGFRPDAGRVSFVNGKKYRTYNVRLDGNRVICARFHGL